MTHQPVDLDKHRGFAARQATELDREDPSAQQPRETVLRSVKDELARLLQAVPEKIRPQVAANSESITRLFTNDCSPQDKERIEHLLDELQRLCDGAKARS